MFIIAQGSSRSVVFMEWDKIWAMNKKVIDPIAPRFTTLNKSYHVEVRIKDVKVESVLADKHPKDPEIGKKTVWRGPVIYIDGNLLFFLQFIFLIIIFLTIICHLTENIYAGFEARAHRYYLLFAVARFAEIIARNFFSRQILTISQFDERKHYFE